MSTGFFRNAMLGAVVGLCGAFVVGKAAALAPAETALQAGLNTLSDDSGEFFVNKVGLSPTVVDVGDVFLGFFGITSYPTTGVPVGSVNELSGVFALRVASVMPLGAGGDGACGGTANIGAANCAIFTFDPVADFAAEWALLIPGLVPLSPLGTTFALVYEDATPDFTRVGATPAAVAGTAAPADALVMDLTLAPGALFATAALDLGAVPPGAAGVGFGGFSGTATIFAEFFPSFSFLPGVAITGNISRSAASEPITVRDDATFTVTAIPEPGTLSLLGIGLAGLGLIGLLRRREQAAH